MMALPDRLALQLSGMTEPLEIKALLDSVVREVLQELHTQLMVEEEEDDEDEDDRKSKKSKKSKRRPDPDDDEDENDD